MKSRTLLALLLALALCLAPMSAYAAGEADDAAPAEETEDAAPGEGTVARLDLAQYDLKAE